MPSMIIHLTSLKISFTYNLSGGSLVIYDLLGFLRLIENIQEKYFRALVNNICTINLIFVRLFSSTCAKLEIVFLHDNH